MKVPSPITNRTSPSSQSLIGPSGRGGTPDAFGAQVGQSVARVGGAVQVMGAYVQQQQDQKRRFDTLRKFTAFQNRTSMALEESKRTADPALANFHEVTVAEYNNAAADFVNNEVPEDLRDEFGARVAELGQGVFNEALTFQYKATDDYFKRGISDAYEESRITLGQNPTLDNLEAQRAAVDEMIENTTLSEPEKVALRRTAYTGLESIVYKAEQIARITDDAAGAQGGSAQRQAVELLSLVSGAPEDELATAALEGEQIAVAQIGSLDVWAAMPARARAALISIAAERGSLPEEVVQAVQAGDLEVLAEAVRAMDGDAPSTAADLILNPGATIDDDPRLSNISYEDRLAMIADAERAAAAQLNAQAQAATNTNKTMVNALHVAILDGSAGQLEIDDAREGGWLTDVDDIVKANKLLADKTEALRLDSLGQQMRAGEVTFVPGNEEHKKILNAMIGSQGLKALDAKDDAFVKTSLIPLVQDTQGIPSSVSDQLAGMMRSTDPSKAYWAYATMAQLQAAAPKAYDQLGAITKDVQFWQDRKDYMPQDQLLKAIRGPLDANEANAQASLRKQGELLFSRENGPMANFDPITLFSRPGLIPGLDQGGVAPDTRWVKEALTHDFQTLFLDAYQRDGNAELATATAKKQLLQVWGMTNVGEDARVMKYPPEKTYVPVRGNYDWIETQMREEGLIAPDENFQLVTDTQTENEYRNGEAPSYVVMKHKDGVMEVLYGADGKPHRQFFDMNAQLQADEAQWKQEQHKAMDLVNAMDQWQRAEQHSLETAIPIPEDSEAAMGIREMMMQEQL